MTPYCIYRNSANAATALLYKVVSKTTVLTANSNTAIQLTVTLFLSSNKDYTAWLAVPSPNDIHIMNRPMTL